jgi:hypothetical protein
MSITIRERNTVVTKVVTDTEVVDAFDQIGVDTTATVVKPLQRDGEIARKRRLGGNK